MGVKKNSAVFAGKWKYAENYGYGKAEGEVVLKQEGNQVSGKIIFTDRTSDEEIAMIQEVLKGEVDGVKLHLNAVEFDIIHADFKIDYMLDNWFGVLVDENTIRGISMDEQGVEGNFIFERMPQGEK